ncbi:MAG: hypothetical protein MI744_00450, partial [Pseudomonadales bacterium]|nr:hypothetical protein [Pseudomonadales bacterium]
MNGRVYDPTLGRFLSADPFVPHPTATQSFNHYSYVKNNPLSYTDPSGFFDPEPQPDPDGNSNGRSERNGPPSAFGQNPNNRFETTDDFSRNTTVPDGDIPGDPNCDCYGFMGIEGVVKGEIQAVKKQKRDFDADVEATQKAQSENQNGNEGAADGTQIASRDHFSDAGFPHDGPGPNGELWDGRAASSQGTGNSTGLTPASCDDCNDPGEVQLAAIVPWWALKVILDDPLPPEQRGHYNINLLEHEWPVGLGHTIKYHVAKTLMYLRNRVHAGNNGYVPERASSFFSLRHATSVINSALNHAHPKIVAWLAGPNDRVVINTVFRNPVGYHVTRERGFEYDYNTRIVLEKSPRFKEGFGVISAYTF